MSKGKYIEILAGNRRNEGSSDYGVTDRWNSPRTLEEALGHKGLVGKKASGNRQSVAATAARIRASVLSGYRIVPAGRQSDKSVRKRLAETIYISDESDIACACIKSASVAFPSDVRA
jgi:hypothetical protein